MLVKAETELLLQLLVQLHHTLAVVAEVLLVAMMPLVFVMRTRRRSAMPKTSVL
jgi:hypothetical protein